MFERVTDFLVKETDKIADILRSNGYTVEVLDKHKIFRDHYITLDSEIVDSSRYGYKVFADIDKHRKKIPGKYCSTSERFISMELPDEVEVYEDILEYIGNAADEVNPTIISDIKKEFGDKIIENGKEYTYKVFAVPSLGGMTGVYIRIELTNVPGAPEIVNKKAQPKLDVKDLQYPDDTFNRDLANKFDI